MHSGMRSDPHVGAFAPVLTHRNGDCFSETESTSISRKPTCWFSFPTGLMVTPFPPVLQLQPECAQGTPLTKHIPSQITQILKGLLSDTGGENNRR